jgi:hypothetical protein
MTIRMRRILFACAMISLIAAGVLGPAGTLAKDLGSIADLLDWISVIALAAGVFLWCTLPLHTGTASNSGRAWKWIVFFMAFAIVLIARHSLPPWTWPIWIHSLCKTFPLLFALALWRQWRIRGQDAAV